MRTKLRLCCAALAAGLAQFPAGASAQQGHAGHGGAAVPPSPSAGPPSAGPPAAADPASPSPGDAEVPEDRARPPAGLGLPELEAMALARNPTLTQAAARVAMSRGAAFQAGLPPNPTVGYQAEQIGVGGTAGELQGVFVQQEFVTGGKLRLSRAKYRQEAGQAAIQADAQRCRVLNGVRTAYYEVLAAERRTGIAREQGRLAEAAVGATAQMLNVGQANAPDVLQARIEARRRGVDVRNAEAAGRAAWIRLAAVTGTPDLPRTPLAGDREPGDVRLDRDSLLHEILACSPELRFVRAEVVRDRIGLDRELAEPVPNVTVQATTGYNFEAEDQVAGLQIGLNVPLWNRNQGTIREARAELVRARAEVARTELELRERFADAWLRYETALASVEDYRDRTLPQSEEAVRLYREYVTGMRAAFPQQLVAERTYAEVSGEYVDSLLELRRAEVELTGLLLVDGVTEPPGPTPQGHRESTPQPR